MGLLVGHVARSALSAGASRGRSGLTTARASAYSLRLEHRAGKGLRGPRRRLARRGALDMASTSTETPADTPTAERRTIRMRRDLGVNYASAGIILDLVDEIDTLRDRIQELEQEIERTRS